MRRLSSAVQAECVGSDHWPPELLPPSHSLPAAYARQLSDSDDAVVPALAPVEQPASAAVCYASHTHFCVHLLRERGRLRYSVDDGLGAVVGRTLHMTRLVTYTFQMVGVHPAHAMVISDSESGPDRRRTQEIAGEYPAADYGIFAFTPTARTPATVWFQSVSRSGLGGPIHIQNTPQSEPRSLPGGTGTPPRTPSTMIFWDAHGATLHRWVLRGQGGAAAGGDNATTSGGGGASAEMSAAAESAAETFGLEMIGHVPLAALARAALYNRTYAAWRKAYDAQMAFSPLPPNITYANVTNSTNQTIVYVKDGVEVNATNMTAAWEEFEATLPKLAHVPAQAVAAALLEPVTSELYWSTRHGHLLSATLRVKRAAHAAADGSEEGAGGSSFGALTRLSVEVGELKLLMVGNESGLEASQWKVGIASHGELHKFVYHDTLSVPRLLDSTTLASDDGVRFAELHSSPTSHPLHPPTLLPHSRRQSQSLTHRLATPSHRTQPSTFTISHLD